MSDVILRPGQLWRLRGCQTTGTIRAIVNNRIVFKDCAVQPLLTIQGLLFHERWELVAEPDHPVMPLASFEQPGTAYPDHSMGLSFYRAKHARPHRASTPGSKSYELALLIGDDSVTSEDGVDEDIDLQLRTGYLSESGYYHFTDGTEIEPPLYVVYWAWVGPTPAYNKLDLVL